MTWNVTEEGIRTRMTVSNEESFPAPIQLVKQTPDSAAGFPSPTSTCKASTSIPQLSPTP
jgi:hypothetical protein